MNDITKELLRPFPKESIKQREGPFDKATQKKKVFDYIGGNDVLRRVIENTLFTWEILSFKLIPAESVVKKGRDGDYTVDRAAYWLVHGRLTIEGLGSRDSMGTQVVENEDSIKGAETDAYKRCAVKFGVAIDLYDSEPPAAAQQQAKAERVAPPTANVAERQKRLEALCAQWEENYTIEHLLKVIGRKTAEAGDDPLWLTIWACDEKQIGNIEKELGTVRA